MNTEDPIIINAVTAVQTLAERLVQAESMIEHMKRNFAELGARDSQAGLLMQYQKINAKLRESLEDRDSEAMKESVTAELLAIADRAREQAEQTDESSHQLAMAAVASSMMKRAEVMGGKRAPLLMLEHHLRMKSRLINFFDADVDEDLQVYDLTDEQWLLRNGLMMHSPASVDRNSKRRCVQSKRFERSGLVLLVADIGIDDGHSEDQILILSVDKEVRDATELAKIFGKESS